MFVTAMLIFGSIGLFVRNIPISSGQVAAVRGLIGSLYLLISGMVIKQKISWKQVKKSFVLLFLSGAAIGFNWIFLFRAYHFTTIANATVSYYFAPVFVILFTPFILKERLKLYKIFCLICAVIGMFLIVGIDSGNGWEQLTGVGYGLLAAILYAGAILINKFLKGLGGLETTLIQLSIATIILIPYVIFTEEIALGNLDIKSWVLLITLGIFHTGLAYLLYFTSIQRLNSQTIAIFSYIDPISAILMSGLFLGERMTGIQMIGGILILGAAFVS
ncbi:MAG TPA: DMT family transporter, partial [Clostridiales bacterium]|nr:DMT family transporter [Clostridiales bacterium]